MSPKDVHFSVIVPTVGRPSLYATLHSVYKGGIQPGDTVTVVGDGPQPEAQRIVEFFKDRLSISYFETQPTRCFGHAQRTFAMRKAKGTHLTFMDDDDAYVNGVLGKVRLLASENPSRVLIFKMRGLARRLGYDMLWRDKDVRIGNVGTPMIVVPNIPEKTGVWTERYAGDFDFIESTVKNFGPDSVVWSEDVIANIS